MQGYVIQANDSVEAIVIGDEKFAEAVKEQRKREYDLRRPHDQRNNDLIYWAARGPMPIIQELAVATTPYDAATVAPGKCGRRTPRDSWLSQPAQILEQFKGEKKTPATPATTSPLNCSDLIGF